MWLIPAITIMTMVWLFRTFCIAVFFLLIHLASPPTISWMEKKFQENYDSFVIVADYLADSKFDEFDYISIDRSDFTKNDYGEFTVSAWRREVVIDDEVVPEAIQRLFQGECYYILRKSEGKVITFTMWGAIGRGVGIAYSIDGSVPDKSSIPYLTSIEPLSEEGWYYYDAGG